MGCRCLAARWRPRLPRRLVRRRDRLSGGAQEDGVAHKTEVRGRRAGTSPTRRRRDRGGRGMGGAEFLVEEMVTGGVAGNPCPPILRDPRAWVRVDTRGGRRSGRAFLGDTVSLAFCPPAPPRSRPPSTGCACRRFSTATGAGPAADRAALVSAILAVGQDCAMAHAET